MFGGVALLSSIAAVFCVDDDLLIRQLSLGAVHGRILHTPNEVAGYAFQGIPYAEPPIGDLRFMAPQPKSRWDGVLETKSYHKDCMWNSSASPVAAPYDQLSEDCLYLNIFSSEKCLKEGNCSVVFYVHGGAWRSQGPSFYGAETLIENFANRNVVMVNFAYRLGFLGLINLAPEIQTLSTVQNLALHDQLTALKFVKKEISMFGGDPNRITLMGHSSGGDNAYALYLSPQTSDLISQVIIMSAPDVEQELVKDQNTKASRKVAELAGCATEKTDYSRVDSVEDVLKCMRAMPVEELLDLQGEAEAAGLEFSKEALDQGGPDPIFPHPTADLIEKKRPLPMLTGTTSKEFNGADFGMVSNGSIHKDRILAFCRSNIDLRNAQNVEEGVRRCVDRYSDPVVAVEIFNDFFTTCAYNVANSSFEAGAPAYLYQFEYSDIGGAYYVKPNHSIPKDREPFHGQELAYLLGIFRGTFTPKDVQIQKQWSQLFVNFINTANPGFGFEPFHPERGNYLAINFDSDGKMAAKVTEGFHSEAVHFWNGLRGETGTLAVGEPKKDDED
ncbi:hypothetical protein QR680_019144 [Steinernema hermaphroditum]|uniref:Carboxylic ester hydrolase n=1 Tax=Steinernema hermaphroditum TaxID=289476 RepID=A0AA39LRT6_9BILA|nr:hypothetical protein QR680_019144 [Steinernema hermaphroditum]